jgi:hypothetical protein
VWPTWMTAHVPRDLKNYSAMRATVHLTHSDVMRKVIDGDPRSRRVKFVCASCNNGWMSQLQERAKPILLPLIKGERTVLGLDAQRLLAGWCAMSVMTSDFFYPETQAIPRADRDYLRDHWMPPSDTWKIWIGRYTREKWQAHYIKNSMPITEEDIAEEGDSHVPRSNSQMTTIVVGQLYIHAFSCPFAWLIEKIATIPANGFKKVAQIWPTREHFIAWPTDPLTDREADSIPGAIAHLIERADRIDRAKKAAI